MCPFTTAHKDVMNMTFWAKLSDDERAMFMILTLGCFGSLRLGGRDGCGPTSCGVFCSNLGWNEHELTNMAPFDRQHVSIVLSQNILHSFQFHGMHDARNSICGSQKSSSFDMHFSNVKKTLILLVHSWFFQSFTGHNIKTIDALNIIHSIEVTSFQLVEPFGTFIYLHSSTECTGSSSLHDQRPMRKL